MNGILTTEHDPAVADLRVRLDEFYARAAGYSAFAQPSDLPAQWAHVREAIAKCVETRGRCRALEIGAGRTGFARSLGGWRERVHFAAQDVTAANRAWLEEEADAVHIGPIASLEGPFDVIFSTFVFEHVSDPEGTLRKLVALLSPGGKLFIFCPRYDWPFYVSHSADHYGPARRLALGGWLLLRRWRTLVTGRPAFVVHRDPAVLHLPWEIDRDAIHWVSWFDVRAFFRGRAEIRKLPIPAGSVKDWIVKNLLQMNVVVTTGGEAAGRGA